MAGGGVKINNITVSGGADGKTPIFKIEAGYLYNSYDNGTTWYSLGEVKGQDGQDGLDGSTGAKIVSLEYQNQDAYGGYIYLMTFDNGTTAYFTAPRGESGANVYYYQADEDDDWFTAIPEEIPSGGIEQYGDTSYCGKVYEGQRDVKVGDLVIMYSPNANSKGQNTVFAVMKEIGGPDNCILQIVSFCEGDEGKRGETGLSALVYNGQVTSDTVLAVNGTKLLYQPRFSRSPIVGDFTTFTLLVNDTDLYNVVAEITEINLKRPPSTAKDYCKATVRYINKLNADLPSVTTADSGKFLRVSADGVWVAEEVPFAEGGEF